MLKHWSQMHTSYAVAEIAYLNLVCHNRLDKGGHFAA